MVYAIIVAGGRGTRLPGHIAKQYLDLAGKPLLSHTVSVFCACEAIDAIVLVVPEADITYCRDHILPRSMSAKDILLVAGGDDRQASVYNGINAVEGADDDIVMIHDGVRPFVTQTMIHSCIDGLGHADGCIAAVPAADTMKVVAEAHRIVHTIDRENVWLAQTPQAFGYGHIRNVHAAAASTNVTATDDAALLERAGKTVTVVPGSSLNIKITTPEDLILARAILDIPGKS
ncbi:MAG: 2-C-methyl-D-erythritol 4-phosphate cytidylyltransferase [Thermodesulfobacteriota bacterium]|nr:2-C-methyl-D-erythritol 4-phosphate cytidylyltransferase [Thermodesulfobacteriota bacterium]